MALDYYRLLGIPPDADQQRIRAVYRKLAKRFHPDANHGSEAAAELFRQVTNAYQVLSDPQRRAEYDRTLKLRPQPAEVRPSASVDPRKKFNRFVSSLLSAIFGPDETPAPKPAATGKTPPPQQQTSRTRPAFNFYYHMAMEKGAPVYRCGKDGVYRKTPKRKPSPP